MAAEGESARGWLSPSESQSDDHPWLHEPEKRRGRNCYSLPLLRRPQSQTKFAVEAGGGAASVAVPAGALLELVQPRVVVGLSTGNDGLNFSLKASVQTDQENGMA